MFAPFIRKVFVVTDQQAPEWLDLEHPGIQVVDHRDIFRDSSHLPTFNSHSIESQLHHIEGLSEHFLYMNDDMLFGRMAQAEDFFDPNGLALVFPECHQVRPELVAPDHDEYLQAHLQAIRVLGGEFGRAPSELMLHAPYALRRSVLFEAEERFGDLWSSTASHRFRSPRDIAPVSFFYPHFALLTGRAVRSTISHRYVPLWSPTLAQTLLTIESRRDYATICLNDAGVSHETAPTVDKVVREFLRSYWPLPSKFEKRDAVT